MENQRKKFGEIYDRYIDKIYRFVFFKVNCQQVAEDLTSDAFLKTWEVFQKNDEKIENIQAFLYATARNLVTDYYRENGKVQVVSAENASIADPRQNPEEKSFLNSDMEKVRHAISGLKDDYQNVIMWHYMDDLPISEVAKLLDRTEGATRVLLHRALDSLRGEIKES